MARAVMIQGTMSNVGKSLIAAGLCRIFSQDGYRTAPFKSQNMALNSYITADGLEMGRAQAVQACAAGVRPCAAMNPILLKPTNDTGSQVIVNGEILGNMSAKDYFSYKTKLIPDIKKAYQTLDAAYDIIVMEGAGSPAEINLKQNDIVNMGMAELADAPVLLVGDIDRGGVFAQLIGTLFLLEEKERARIKGLIINKFRGDKSILAPGVEMLEARAGKPVFGVTPYMQVDIEEEDSLSERFGQKQKKTAFARIAVIRFPRISNYTDFLALEESEWIQVDYVFAPQELGTPDLIILPGTKNTIDDLRWFRECGLEAAVLRCCQKKVPILGICGGYQMMGLDICDKAGAEGGGEIRGMGLLPVHTIFQEEKIRTQVCGKVRPLEQFFAFFSGMQVEGYEIHMGRTVLDESAERAHLASCFADIREKTSGQPKVDGCQKENACGTYLHGVFDAPGIVPAIVQAFAKKKGMESPMPFKKTYAQHREEQFDKLADCLREHLDMEAIYRIMGKS